MAVSLRRPTASVERKGGGEPARDNDNGDINGDTSGVVWEPLGDVKPDEGFALVDRCWGTCGIARNQAMTD